MTTLGNYGDLAGRAALVTGGSSGIGHGIAEALLGQGMRVAVQYRGNREAAEALCARHPGRAVALSAELGEERGCLEVPRKAREAVPDRALLAHSAGIGDTGPMGDPAPPVRES